MARSRPPRQTQPPDHLLHLRTSLAALERVAQAAEDAESYTAAVQARVAAVRTRGQIEQLERVERAKIVPSTPEERRAELLVVARILRVEAHAAGSYVAAAKLLDFEDQLQARASEAVADEDARRLRARSTEDIAREIEELRRRRGR